MLLSPVERWRRRSALTQRQPPTWRLSRGAPCQWAILLCLSASLGYEPTDARLYCLGQSPVTVLTSADPRPEILPGLPRLPRLTLSRRVRFTAWFTEPVPDMLVSIFSAGAIAHTSAVVRPVAIPRTSRVWGWCGAGHMAKVRPLPLVAPCCQSSSADWVSLCHPGQPVA